MKTTINNKLLSRTLFFSAVFFITVFFSDWYGGIFFLNRNYRILKYFLCLIIPIITVWFNFVQEKSLKFIGKSSAIIMSCFVVFFILFSLLEAKAFSFREMASLYHISYALLCIFSVFLSSTMIARKNKHSDYNIFYNDFFLGYIPIMILLYILFYLVYRAPDIEYEVNLIPFKGEFKNLAVYFSSQTLMRTVGNVLFYSTIALTAARFIKKHTAFWCFIIPFLLCVLTEVAQGLFSLGDADIDDVILNGFGALIGALLYRFVIQDLRRKEICSE